MGGDSYFYEGANYGFDPEYGGTSQAYSSQASGLGLATDPRTANQLKATSEKLNTGANVIEVSSVSPDIFESIPKQHFAELNRLRKLVGNNVELTLHAPIIEPSGLTKRGWNPLEREQAERQMFDAIAKAHELNPEGNVVTTFHSSAGLPGEVKVWKEVEGKKVPEVQETLLIDERTGEIGALPKAGYLEPEKDIKSRMDKLNNENWSKNLQHVGYWAEQGARAVDEAYKTPPGGDEKEKKEIFKIFKDYAEGKIDKAEEELKKVPELRNKMQEVLNGDLYLRDAYNNLRNLYDQAYDALKRTKTPEAKNDLEKLDKFREEIRPLIQHNKYLNPEKMMEFKDKIREGVHVLRSIETPEIYKPLNDFAIDKSSETFANLAFESYNKFGEHAPIISIENPPAGTALSTGKELNQLIDKVREKFVEREVNEKGMSREHAKREAEKLIGATWDVGHINMLRKFGAGEKELLEETKAIAKKVKHVHLSDNFGMEHTELPMGMGNVPTKEMTELIKEYSKKFKKIIEVGNWYQHFQTTPFAESLQHFDSPIYAMKNASYWGPQGGYFAGYGMNPDVHHSLYGAGFSNLPIELGGQMSGRSRVSGNPLD